MKIGRLLIRLMNKVFKKKRTLILINKRGVEIGITTCGWWYWKPEMCGHKISVAKLENSENFEYVNTVQYFVPTVIQFFFLRWILYIKIPFEKIGEGKYVDYYKSHLWEIEKAFGKENKK